MYNLNSVVNPIENSQRLVRAISDAAKWHQNSFRKGTDIPYIAHPFGAMSLLQMYGIDDEEVLISALFHDLIEDTPCTLDYIENHYGKRIAKIVNGVTETDKSFTWEQRKLHTLENLRKQAYEVKLVTLADKLNNLLSLSEDFRKHGDKIWLRFKRGQAFQRWYYVRLVQEFSKDLTLSYHPMFKHFSELVQVVFQLPKYKMPELVFQRLDQADLISFGEGFLTLDIPYKTRLRKHGMRQIKDYAFDRLALMDCSKENLQRLLIAEDVVVPLASEAGVALPLDLSFGVQRDQDGLECLILSLVVGDTSQVYCQTRDLVSID